MLLQLPVSLEAGLLENQDPTSASIRPRLSTPRPLQVRVSALDWALGLLHEWGLDASVDERLASVTSSFADSGGTLEFTLESTNQPAAWTVSSPNRWQDSSEM